MIAYTRRPRTAAVGLDQTTATKAVVSADLRALSMMVFHYTGDRYWLGERFRPIRDVRIIAPEDAGLPEDVQQEIREAAVKALTSGSAPLITDPDEALFLRMLRQCLNEEVPAEYVPMMRQQMGFESLVSHSSRRPSDVGSPSVLIVGAGESAIVLGATLNDLGIDYDIVERGATVGGTWRRNVYPGCAVDTPNHAYSYSFGEPYEWSRYFSDRRQVHGYLEACADDFGVRRHMSFHTTLVSATWCDESATWKVVLQSASGQQSRQYAYVVSAIGPFGEPQRPRISGLSSFQGEMFHSADWPEDIDLAGRRVVILGTGASAMQIAPTIADSVASLTIVQRTPQWVRPIPRFHDEIDQNVTVLLRSQFYYSAWYRFLMLWRYGDGLLPTLRKDPHWPHPRRSVNKANDRHRQQLTKHLRDKLSSRPDLVEKCLPDYPPYGKRILLDNDWYDTLLKPQVELETTSVSHFEERGVRLADGRLLEADVVILATGFDLSRSAARLDVTGRDGHRLIDTWAGGIGAHLGIAVPNYPNFFIMLGPTTGLAHGGSLVYMSEMQARYIGLLIRSATDNCLATVEVKQSVHDDYLARVDAEHEHLVWTHPGMSPYFRNGFGKVRTVFPWRMVDYFTLTREPDLDEFEVRSGRGPDPGRTTGSGV